MQKAEYETTTFPEDVLYCSTISPVIYEELVSS